LLEVRFVDVESVYVNIGSVLLNLFFTFWILNLNFTTI
jgi:hypothetical protein